MKTRFILILLFFGFVTEIFGLVEPEDRNEALIFTEPEASKTEAADTLKINTLSVNLDLLFNITHKQTNQYPDLKFINMAQVNYVPHYTDYGLYFRQILDRLSNGYLYYNHYLNLSAGIAKYKPHTKLHFLYPEPVFIFQNNSARGLHHRFQAGVFFYPVRYFRPKIKLNFGLGCLHDWSSWEVNDMDKINASKPEVREKILFVNSHTKLRDDMYMDNAEFRPTLFLNLNWQITEMLQTSVFFSHQQSLVSPFNDEVKTAYPELKKVYPYIYLNWAVGAKLHKGFSLKTSFILDYENNNLSIYDSSWEYSILLGIAWNFTK